MLTLGVMFRKKQPEAADVWMVVQNLLRDPKGTAMVGDQEFALTTDGSEAHVFYTHEELLGVMGDIQRVLNKRGYQGEEFNEEMEHTKACVVTIRQYLSEGHNCEFAIFELKPERIGTVAISIRSDKIN